MPRFAVQFPAMLMADPSFDFNANRPVFIRDMKPVIYWPEYKYRFTRGIDMRKQLKSSSLINPDEFEFAFSERELNRKADILVHFNHFPVNTKTLQPPRKFNGLKVWHVFEYVFRVTEVNKMLEDHGVDYVLGYTDHGKYCPFFQKHYPKYVDKVISYPFGTSKRFLVDSDWQQRKQKVIALGSVNLVNEPVEGGVLDEYAAFYAHKQWTHEWRRMLAENEMALAGVMDSQLPHYPEMKNTAYDAVQMMTGYSMFANDEGLLAFPPARTFEGPAAGCVMISSDHSCFKDLGFQDGINCIMHNKHDIEDFRKKAAYYIERPVLLRQIAEAGKKLVRQHYTHEAVAARLAKQLEIIYTSGKKPEGNMIFQGESTL